MSRVELGTRPTPGQMMLLRAALSPPADAVSAWREWRGTTEFDEAGWGQFQLLPLAAANLPEGELDAEVAGRIAGLRRMTWSRNQLLFHAAGEAASALTEAGLPPLIIKGAALAQTAYGDLGVRPMFDVDLLVPFGQAREALAALSEDGWSTPYPDPEARIAVHHSMELSRGSGELDLHWQSLWLGADDAPIWEAAVPACLGGVEVSAASAADNLLIVCVHGLPWEEVPNTRWIADAATLIRSSGDAIDWERLVAEARRRRLSPWVATALRYLRVEIGVEEVPEAVVAELDAENHSRAGLRVLESAMSPDSPLRTYRMARERHRRLLAMGAETPRRFSAFARDFWGVDSTAKLPLHAVRRLRRAARVRLSAGRDSARSVS